MVLHGGVSPVSVLHLSRGKSDVLNTRVESDALDEITIVDYFGFFFAGVVSFR